MLIRGQPVRQYLAEHPDMVVLIWCVICFVVALGVTIGERG